MNDKLWVLNGSSCSPDIQMDICKVSSYPSAIVIVASSLPSPLLFSSLISYPCPFNIIYSFFFFFFSSNYSSPFPLALLAWMMRNADGVMDNVSQPMGTAVPSTLDILA